ncbi:MAG: hypothetical protein M1814_002940 [Vezdaea aestivalis]|nr:MAG: hypothetical protein M1814_002940 [Vezdaea aestivalis]
MPAASFDNMGAIISFITAYVAPVFLIVSPITSYVDQIWSIHKRHTSKGFSLDIPLIMLVSSIFRVFYWFGARFDTALLVQAFIMIIMQTLLLKVSLDNRPMSPMKSETAGIPFSGNSEPEVSRRPFDFWQWRRRKPYWEFLMYFFVTLAILQWLIGLGTSKSYTTLLGLLALGIEATLPLPQILHNYNSKSCAGFRLSVLINWIAGDVMKMTFFFFADSNIPVQFKACGIFQFICDLGLGYQFWIFGDGQPALSEEKDLRLK